MFMCGGSIEKSGQVIKDFVKGLTHVGDRAGSSCCIVSMGQPGFNRMGIIVPIIYLFWSLNKTQICAAL